MVVVAILEAIAIGLLALLVAGLLRSHAEILRALHSLGADATQGAKHTSGGHTHGPLDIAPMPRGAETPRAVTDISGLTLGGEVAQFGVGGNEDTLVAFLSSGCSTCQPLWHGLASAVGPGSSIAGMRLVVVTRDPAEESQSALSGLCPPQVAMVMSTAAWEAYGIAGSPYFVHIAAGSETVTGEGVARSWEQVQDMVGRARPAQAGGRVGGSGEHAGSPFPPGRSGSEREANVDYELARAGITPGHPSLYPTRPTDQAGEQS